MPQMPAVAPPPGAGLRRFSQLPLPAAELIFRHVTISRSVWHRDIGPRGRAAALTLISRAYVDLGRREMVRFAGWLDARSVHGLVCLLGTHPHLSRAIRDVTFVGTSDLDMLLELFSRPLRLAQLGLTLSFEKLVALSDLLARDDADVRIATLDLVLQGWPSQRPTGLVTRAYSQLLNAIGSGLVAMTVELRSDGALGASTADLLTMPLLRYFDSRGLMPAEVARVIKAADGPLTLGGDLTDDLVFALAPLDSRKIHEGRVGCAEYGVWLSPAGWSQLTDLSTRILADPDVLWADSDVAALPPSLTSLHIQLVPAAERQEEGHWCYTRLAICLEDTYWLPHLASLEISEPMGADSVGIVALEAMCVSRGISLIYANAVEPAQRFRRT